MSAESEPQVAEIYEATKEEFEKFKTKFGKKYHNEEEESRRYAAFVENVKRINDQNKSYNEGKSTWRAGINQFADKMPGEKVC